MPASHSDGPTSTTSFRWNSPSLGDNGPNRRVLLLSKQFNESGHTGGFRWWSIVRDLVQEGWTFDVLTVAGAEAAPPSPPSGHPSHSAVEIHTVPPDWWAQPIRRAAAGAVETLRDAMDKAFEGEKPGDSSPEAVDPAEAKPWKPGDRQPWKEQIGYDMVGATVLLTESVWAWRAYWTGRDLARKREYAAVVATSPNFQGQVAAALLNRQFGIPYVADFRNLWYYGFGCMNDFIDDAQRVANRIMERWALPRADAIVHITEAARDAHTQATQSWMPEVPRYYVPNGHDAVTEPVPPPDPSTFRVAHTGWVYPFNDVRPLMATCGRFRRRHDLAADEFCLEFMGSGTECGGVSYDDLARAYGIDDCFAAHPRRPRGDARRLQQAAAVKVAFDYPHGRQIPSKLYHYAQTRGNLLLLGNPNGAMADEAAKIGESVLALENEAGMDRVLNDAYARWQAGAFTEPIDAEGRFSIRRASERMHKILEGLPAPAQT